MNEPERVSPGTPITASAFNRIVDYARSQHASLPSIGGQIFGSQAANGSAAQSIESVILVYATEDFVSQTTDSGIVDDVPSGLCDFVRLTQSTNTHQNSSGRPFFVHDVLAELSDGNPKSSGDVFYAVWNHDSKRWEALSSSGVRLQAAIVLQCIGMGWHEIELCDWAGRPPLSDSFSVSDSVSESCENDTEAGADSHCRMRCDLEPCQNLSDGQVPMDPCTTIDTTHYPNYAHTTRQLPMLTGGLIKVIRRTGAPVGVVEPSDSTSASEDDPWYFDVVDGCWPIKRLTFPAYAVCTDPITGECRVIQTSETSVLVEGYACPTVDLEECDEESISASGEPP